MHTWEPPAALKLLKLPVTMVAGIVVILSLSMGVASPAPAGHQAGQAMSLAGLQRLLGSEASMGSLPGGAPAPAVASLHQAAAPLRSANKKCAHAPAHGFLHTSGVWIVDKNNCKVRLVGATWYGMQTTYYVPAGLDFLPYQEILSKIKQLGFNTIRIPLSDELVRYNKKLHVNNSYLQANPDLQNLHPLQVLDKIVAAAGKLKLMIILDNHFSVARTPASYGKHSHARKHEATWITKGYSEQTWINDWLTVTHRYRGDPTVIGFDLRNEPHTDGPGPWSLKTYLKQGATWGRYPSKMWKPSSDWAAAATKAGNHILSVNPHLLMFVEGVQLYPDPKGQMKPLTHRGVETYWWGSILRGVLTDPIHFRIGHQLVYSPHEWGPWKYNLGQFSYKTTYKYLSHIFGWNWAFILHSKNPKIRAPIWLGEFNTCNTRKKCVNAKAKGSQGEWFQLLLHYLRDNPEINWSYYPLNGSNSFDEPSNNSILNPNWTQPRLPDLMKALRPLEKQPKN